MAKIANVALTDTFDTWRIRSNQSFDRLSQFAINNSKLYANTVIANNTLKSLGNTVLGVSGKKTVVNGLLSANGRMTVSTNLNVTGNTAVGTNLTVGGNVIVTAANTTLNLTGAKLQHFSEHANTAINTGSAQTVTDDTNFVRYTVSASCTITLPSNASNPAAPAAVKTVVLFFKQNGTGGYTVTLAAPSGGAIKYNNSASQPAVNTNANKVTIYHCMKFDGDNTWYVSQSYIDA